MLFLHYQLMLNSVLGQLQIGYYIFMDSHGHDGLVIASYRTFLWAIPPTEGSAEGSHQKTDLTESSKTGS